MGYARLGVKGFVWVKWIKYAKGTQGEAVTVGAGGQATPQTAMALGG
jgi:hypothetical protein